MQSIIYYTDTENKHFCMSEGYNVLKKKKKKKKSQISPSQSTRKE